jgi:hypothetical protein
LAVLFQIYDYIILNSYRKIKFCLFFVGNKMFTCNLDQHLYKDIINEYLFPFVAEKYNYKVTLHQDNDPKHNSKLCKETLVNNNIKWVKTKY